MTSKMTNKFSPEVRAQAVQMVLDHVAEHASRRQAMLSITAKMGCSAHSLNEWLKKAELDAGKRASAATDMSATLKPLSPKPRVGQANEILRKACSFSPWRSSTADRRHDRVHR